MFLFKTTKEEKFWKYFQKNEEIIYNFEKNQEKIFDELTIELHKIDSNLTFEFGPIKNNKRDFVISADGIESSFPFVENLCKEIPKLNFFNVIKFRPRRESLSDIEIAGIKIESKKVKYVLVKDEDPNKVGIILFFENYKEESRNLFSQIGFLFLDEALGEFDVETKVGFINFTSYDSDYFINAKPLKELGNNFDNYFNFQN